MSQAHGQKHHTEFAKNVLSWDKLKALLPADVLEKWAYAVETGNTAPKEVANVVAEAVRKWAVAQGADQYAHIFFPICRPAALKYNTFIQTDFSVSDWSHPLPFFDDKFAANLMLFSETDGSSFPNGGLRETHAAAAYLAWDRTESVYLRDSTLFIPSTFVSFHGDALDEKTPLLRGIKAVDKAGTRLLHLLGHTEVKHVVSQLGIEQEFFLISREMFLKRPDLVQTGRTLVGALPPHNQQLSDHYFAPPPTKVRHFFKQLKDECVRLGIAFSVSHNEVAPCQHEWSPLFTQAHIAADENAIAMQLMQEVANRNGLVCLLHEKPFKGINGSGKHNNWSINSDNGINFFAPGKSEKDELVFLAGLAIIARAVKQHGDIIRLGVATPNNDHRLGAHEAPPAIFSLYIGHELTDFVEKITQGGPLLGYKGAADRFVDSKTTASGKVPTGPEDRNRTAPVPWCGNRFELRAVGSSQNCNWPMACLSAAIADSLNTLSDAIEKTGNAQEAIRAMLKENKGSIFAGNGYSSEWHKEAVEQRGLKNIRNTPAALDVLSDPKNIRLFSQASIFSEKELAARQEALYEHYSGVLLVEANTLQNMLDTQIIPALNKDLIHAGPLSRGNRLAAYTLVADEGEKLRSTIAASHSVEGSAARAHYFCDKVKHQMAEVRKAVDAAEALLPHDLYPFPKYSQIFAHHYQDSAPAL